RPAERPRPGETEPAGVGVHPAPAREGRRGHRGMNNVLGTATLGINALACPVAPPAGVLPQPPGAAPPIPPRTAAPPARLPSPTLLRVCPIGGRPASEGLPIPGRQCCRGRGRRPRRRRRGVPD